MSTLFTDPAWLAVIDQGLGCQSEIVSAPDAADNTVALSGFRRGPWRAGYANFPVGLNGEHRWFFEPFITGNGKRIATHKIDLLRINIDETDVTHWTHLTPPDQQLPDTTIPSLQAWDESTLSSDTRYKLRRSHRDGVRIRESTTADAALVYQLYSAAIAKNSGSLRYTPRYFEALTNLAAQHRQLQIGIAEADGAPCGFIAIAHDADASYYLHGGFFAQYRKLRPGYSAMAWAIHQSIDRHSNAFHMLPSPADQAELVKFKESFLGVTTQRLYWDIPLTARGWALKKALQLKARLG
ncbi:MAG TPA: GNAT family N-acetyltransferase [Pseudomonadales bacterium]